MIPRRTADPPHRSRGRGGPCTDAITAGWRLLAFLAPILLSTSCGDGSTAPATPQPDKVLLAPAEVALSWVGDSWQFAAQAIDQFGRLLRSEPLEWSSENPSVAIVSSSGLVVATGPGETTIMASAGLVSQSASVTVRPVPETISKVSGDEQEGDIGAPLPHNPVVEVQDRGGVPVAGVEILWAVTAGEGRIVPDQNATGADGRASVEWVLGDLPGTHSVTARLGEMEVEFTAEGIAEFSVLSITPMPLQEGKPAFVTGTYLAGSTVSVEGIRAEITEFSHTQITFTVPVSCQPSRETTVTVGRTESSEVLATTVVPQVLLGPLSVGDGWLDQGTNREGHCMHLSEAPEDVSYLIGVQSMAEGPSVLTPVNFTMATGVVGEALPPALASGPESPSVGGYRPLINSSAGVAAASAPGGAGVGPPAMDSLLLRHSAAHLEQRAEDAEEIDRLLSIPGSTSFGPQGPAGQAPRPPSIGSEVSVNVPDGCREFTTITATVRAVGERSIWVEDQNNPAGGFSDADYRAQSAAYDDVIGERLDHYLGPPTDLDGNGRVVVVVTREVNDIEGNVLGFVVGADLFPTRVCPASNEGEYYYGFAPDPEGVTGLPVSLERTRGLYPALIAHEVTHIVHLSRLIHFVQIGLVPPFWEIEGTATLMEELVGHGFTGLGSGQNLTSDPLFNNFDWYGSYINDLALYFGFIPGSTAKVPGAPQECSWLGRPPNGPCAWASRLPYGIPALLLRWIADQFYTPATEHEMTRALMNSPVHGFDLLWVLTRGTEPDAVLASWAAALLTDDTYFSDGERTVSSWNFGEIYSSIRPTARPEPAVRGYDFSETFNVRGGSTAYFLVNGSHGQITFGAPSLPPHMRLWVVRVE